jgi:glycosyltransferase involved in cell wall biosynthesis
MKLSCLHFTCELNPRMGGILTGIEETTIHLNRFDIAGTIVSLGNSRIAFRAVGPRISRLNEEGIETVLTKFWFTNSYGLGWNSRKFVKILEESDYSLVVLHQVYTLSTLVGYRYAKKRGIPYAVFPHGSLTRYHESDSKLIKRIAKRVVISKILKSCDSVIVTCRSELEDLDDHLQSKAVLLPYGANVNHGLQEVDTWEEKQPENMRILFSGRFDKKKNIPTILRAVKLLHSEYPHIVLDVAGLGTRDEKNLLTQLVQDLNLESNVVFHGWVDRNRLSELISSSRALVLPSENENFALVVSEALSAGVPCVVSKFVGTSDIVDKYHAGVVIDDLTPNSLAEGMMKILKGDQSAYRRAAFMATRKELDWSRISRLWREFIQSLA